MLKTFSVLLLAGSIIAAPAFAAGFDKNAHAPGTKTAQAKQTTPGSSTKAQTRPGAVHLNAHSGKHKTVRHQRSHQQVGGMKTHQLSKVSTKGAALPAKRS
jgi:hypothetical protein